MTTVGYQLKSPSDVAIVGAGGGRDILAALLVGASSIDAVELNPQIIDVVSVRFADFSGDIYHAPGVDPVASKGRSYLTHTDGKYDLIQISRVDSWAGSTAGAFALAENNLYTVEAFQLYLDRLSEGGIISTSRWMGELPRLIVLAKAALVASGVENPAKHLLVVSARNVATLLTSKDPFRDTQVSKLDEICQQRGFKRQYPALPGRPASHSLVLDAVDRGLASLEAFGFNMAAPTDDSPYFFHVVSPFSDPDKINEELVGFAGLDFNFKSSVLLRQLMIGVSFMAVALFLLPFLLRSKSAQTSESMIQLLAATAYFALIGFAFMLIENLLIQRFVLYLGHPSYATMVVIACLLLGMGGGRALQMNLVCVACNDSVR